MSTAKRSPTGFAMPVHPWALLLPPTAAEAGGRPRAAAERHVPDVEVRGAGQQPDHLAPARQRAAEQLMAWVAVKQAAPPQGPLRPVIWAAVSRFKASFPSISTRRIAVSASYM